MKKLSLLFTLFFAVGLIYAQTSQGNLLVAGSASVQFGSQKQESFGSTFEDKIFGISASPTVGFFVADGIMIGGMVDVSLSKNTNKADADTYFKSTMFTFGPVGRYYHSSDYFGELYVAIGSEVSESSSGGFTNTFKESIFGFSIGAGKAIFLNEFVALEPMFKFVSMRHTDSEDSANFRTTATPQIALALTIFIGE